MRSGAGVSASIVSNARPPARRDLAGASAPGGRAADSSSTSVFHAPQAEHWPDHLECTAPQAWQV